MAKDSFLYQKLVDGIRQDITQGTLKEGQKLPSPEELMKQYDVSRITVTRALTMLAEEGLIRRVQGQGSFVENHQRFVKKERKKTAAIGVILEHLSTPFGLDMMYQLDLYAQKYGYKTLVRFSLGSIERETEEIEYLLQLGIDGLIIMPCHGKYYNQTLLKLYLDDFPVVMVDKNMQGIEMPSVRTDNAAAVRTLVEKLAKQGCRNIAFLSSDDTNVVSVRQRRRGFIEGIDSTGVSEAGIVVLPIKCTPEELLSKESTPEVYAAVRKFVEEHARKADAVICSEYGIVRPLLQVLREKGIEPEKDLRIATVDADYLAPGGYPFMHMKQDENRIAQRAVELLAGQMQSGKGGKKTAAKEWLIPAVFVDSSQKGFL